MADSISSPSLPGKLSTLDSFFGLNKGKYRLYIALYDLRGFISGHSQVLNRSHQKMDYQWALLVVPKEQDSDIAAYRYLMRRIPSSASPSGVDWKAEGLGVPFNRQHGSILVRVLIAKITDLNRLGRIFLNFEIRSREEPRTDMTWIRDMVAELKRDGKCCSHLPEWVDIEKECVDFAMKAVSGGVWHIPELDMIGGEEGEGGTKQPVVVDVGALRRP